MIPTVVLVHGAMHTPWIFTRLRDVLARRGLASLAVQLPSSHPDSAEAGGLVDDLAAVRGAVAEVDGPVVLAAHSYGGVPATWAAATEPAVRGLVMIAAFALPVGSAMLDGMGGDFPPSWIRSPDGRAVRVGDAKESIFSGVDPGLAAEAVARLNWQGVGAFTQRLGAVPDGSVTTTYLVATEDRALPPHVQEEWASRADRRFAVASGHSPHLSHPEQVADAIEATVRAVQGGDLS